MREQIELFTESVIEQIQKPGHDSPNPMVRAFGPGPEDHQCKNCRFLYGKRYNRIFYKCEHRGDTNGPGTDHRVKWPACSKFEEDLGGENNG